MRGQRKLLPLGLVSTKKVNTLVYCLALLFLFLWTENAFSAGRKSLIEVRDLKYQSNAGYERVVVYLSTGGSFTSHKLSEPRRFFIDLENARIGNSLKRHHQIMNDFLKTVRIGQFNRKTVRIVFDLEKNGYKEKISRLEEPPRLVIDIFPRNPMKQHALSVEEKTGSKECISAGRGDSPRPCRLCDSGRSRSRTGKGGRFSNRGHTTRRDWRSGNRWRTWPLRTAHGCRPPYPRTETRRRPGTPARNS